MHPHVKAKLGSIEEARRESRKKGVRYILIAIFLIIILLANYYYFENSLIHNVSEFIIIATIFLVLGGFVKIFKPLEEYDVAFCKIIEASKNIEDSIINTDLQKLAYQKVLDAAEVLESVDVGNAPWYSNIKKIEKRFFKNLKNRLAPAILKGEVSHLPLQDIARVFINPDIEKMEEINQKLEKYEEIEIPDTGYTLTVTSFLKSKIGKATSSILLGYTAIILFSIFYSLWIKKDFRLFFEENPAIILTGGAILSGAFVPFLLREI